MVQEIGEVSINFGAQRRRTRRSRRTRPSQGEPRRAIESHWMSSWRTRRWRAPIECAICADAHREASGSRRTCDDKRRLLIVVGCMFVCERGWRSVRPRTACESGETGAREPALEFKRHRVCGGLCFSVESLRRRRPARPERPERLKWPATAAPIAGQQRPRQTPQSRRKKRPIGKH